MPGKNLPAVWKASSAANGHPAVQGMTVRNRSSWTNKALVRSRHSDLRHPLEIQHVVDLAIRQHVLALDEISNQNSFLDRSLADVGRLRVTDLRRECGRERC